MNDGSVVRSHDIHKGPALAALDSPTRHDRGSAVGALPRNHEGPWLQGPIGVGELRLQSHLTVRLIHLAVDEDQLPVSEVARTIARIHRNRSAASGSP